MEAKRILLLGEPDNMSNWVLLVPYATAHKVRAIKLKLSELSFEVCPKRFHDKRLACNLDVIDMDRDDNDDALPR